MNSTPTILTSTIDVEDCYPLPDTPQKLFFFTLHLVVILIGVPSNAFSLFVSCQHIRQENELGIYLFNLALSDLCFIMGLPVWMDYTYTDVWRYSSTVCAVCVFLLFTNFYTSAMLLSCIAIDRYLAVVHPLRFTSLRKLRAAAAVSAGAWTLTFIFNSFTISMPDIYDKDTKVCLDVFPLQMAQRKVLIARSVLGFLLPAVVVLFCYWKICMEVQSNKATGLSERRRVFKLLGSVLLSLCICFGPIHVMMVLRAVLEECRPHFGLFLLYKISVALSTLNCLADPLLYCFITKTGQASVSKALLRLKGAREQNCEEFSVIPATGNKRTLIS